MIKLNASRKKIIILTSLALLYILPLIQANVYFTDDMKRIVQGYGWDIDGRFIATYLMKALSFGEVIVSPYPLSLIISSLIITVSGLIITHTLNLEDGLKIKLSPLILLISPFFLENLAYRYDSIPMSLSILFSITPFLFYKKISFIPISIVCIFLSFGLYQTSTMIYFSMLVCIQMKNIQTDKIKILLKLSISCIASFFFAYFLYKWMIDLLHIDLPRSKTLPINSELFHNLKERILVYLKMFRSLFYQSKYMYAIMPLSLLCFTSLFFTLLKRNNSVFSIIIKLLLTLSLYILILILMLMPNLILETIWYTARTMVAFPFAIYAMLVFIPKISNTYVKITYYSFMSLLFYFCFLFSSLFGEILKNNNDYFNFISENVSSQIMRDSSESDVSIGISGYAPIPERSKLIYANYPFLYHLAPFYMIEGWSWGISDLSRYINYSWSKNTDDMVNNKCSMNTIYKSSIFFLRRKNDDYLVDFSKENCQ